MTTSPKNADIDAYIQALDTQRATCERLRELIHETVPGCQEAFKWKQPVFGNPGDFVYFKANKAHVNLGFNKGSALPDPDGLLEGSGKDMRHVKIRSAEDMPEASLVALIKAASELK